MLRTVGDIYELNMQPALVEIRVTFVPHLGYGCLISDSTVGCAPRASEVINTQPISFRSEKDSEETRNSAKEEDTYSDGPTAQAPIPRHGGAVSVSISDPASNDRSATTA